MEKKKYSELLKSPKWQKKRLEIFKRDKFQCRLCKDAETTLHVHHKEYITGNDPWDYPNDFLITLCEHCHFEIEVLAKELGEIDFDTLKIYKSDHWTGKCRIMFISHYGKKYMRIYDKDNACVIGFSLSQAVTKRMISLLKY